MTAARHRVARGLWFAGARSPAEAAVLALLAVWSLVPLAILYAHGSGGGVFTGADFPDVVDQLQYLAWVREAGEHVLISNRFDLVSDPHLFLHPVYLISGLAWRMGVSLQLAVLAWKPVWVLLIFAGFAAYVRRLVDAGPWTRAAALVLALFMMSFTTPLIEWLDLGGAKQLFGVLVIGLEMFPGDYFAGAGVVAIGLMPLFLLGIEILLDPARASTNRSMRWYTSATAAAGLLVSWLHPWQGLTLLVIVAALVAWARLWRRVRVLVMPLVATAVPLVYFQILAHTDSAWQAVAKPNSYPHFGGWLFLVLLPPLLLAAPGIPGRDLDLQERMLRLWPLAGFVVYLGLHSSWIYHAFVGLSLPLAILAVQGARRLRVPAAIWVLAILAFTVPGAVFYLERVRGQHEQHFLPQGDARALAYLSSAPGAGGVFAREPVGSAVPAFSDRDTWVGHPTWTPGWGQRAFLANALVTGQLPADQTRALVRKAGARFVLGDCGARRDLRAALGPLVLSVRRFGCATVYEITPG